jgi:hypothetical protein
VVFGCTNEAAGLRQINARGMSKVVVVFRRHVMADNLIPITILLSDQTVMP